MLNRFIILIALLFVTWSFSEALAQDVHDHEAETKEIEVDEHAGHDHGEGAYIDEEELGDELTVKLSDEAVKLAGIKISTVKKEKIGKTIELPGEIGFNEDWLVHIAPRFAGIALETNYRVGDYVKAGEIVAIIESNESMNPYSIKTPISGWVIDRHITPGEYVSEENSIFIIADLSTVWVNLAVYPKDASHIKRGQTVTIKNIGTNNETSGVIEYISPIMDLKTRSLTARIILANPDNKWRPGSFVQTTIATELGTENLVVEKNAVQYLDGKSVVFVLIKPNQFKPVEVIIGESNSIYVQIKSGLSETAGYVSVGAFELKAKIITSNMDAHAGHGH